MPDRMRRKRHPGRQLVTPDPEPEVLPAVPDEDDGDIDTQVATRLAEAHPIYGVFGHVFKEMGGVDRLQEWAEEEPGKFYAIFAKMVPREQSANQINIQINAKLAPGPLDE